MQDMIDTDDSVTNIYVFYFFFYFVFIICNFMLFFFISGVTIFTFDAPLRRYYLIYKSGINILWCVNSRFSILFKKNIYISTAILKIRP